MVTALAIVAVAVGVAAVAWGYSPTARRRSTAWRERTIQRHGQRGYTARRALWQWGPVVVIIIVAVLVAVLR